MTTQQSKIRKQVRTFVLVWTFITLMMGMATFLAIYFTYPLISPQQEDGLNVALNTGGSDPVVVIPSNTPLPATATATPLPTATPTNTPEPTELAPEPTEIPTETPIPSPTPTIPPVKETRFEVGIQVQFSLDFNPGNQDGYYYTVKENLGMDWVKNQVRWEYYEPQRGQYDWSVLDFVLPSAERMGLKTMLSIVAAPAWAREPGVDPNTTHGPPADPQDFVRFLTALLQRYPQRIHAIEVWNEMNLAREWASPRGIRADDYVALLREAYRTIKALDPNIIVISGAPSNTGVDDGVTAVDDFVYVERLIRAGALDHMDCFGVHHNGFNMPPLRRWNEGYNDPTARFRGPFDNPHHSWSFRSTIEGYAQRIRGAGRTTPLCMTEFGWPSSEDLEGYPRGYEFAGDNTLAEQAQWMREALDLMAQSGYMRLAFVWNLNYGPQAGWNKDNDNVIYSLIGPNWQFRPAFDEIRAWLRDYKARVGLN